MQIWKMDPPINNSGAAHRRTDGVKASDLLKAALVGLCGALISLILQILLFKSGS